MKFAKSGGGDLLVSARAATKGTEVTVAQIGQVFGRHGDGSGLWRNKLGMPQRSGPAATGGHCTGLYPDG